MRIFKKTAFLVILALITIVHTGCWDMKLYEEIGFIMQFGLENDQNGDLLISMTSPVVSPDAKESSEVLSTSTKTLIRSSREMLRNSAGKMLQGGKVQHVFFSSNIARIEGIYEYLEIFIRNPENPMLANVVIVEGSPKEMMELNLKYTDKPRPSYYMADLLKDAHRRSAAPETRIFNFSILHYSGTTDPVVPYVRYNDKDIEIVGSALFVRDKMVGDIDTKQTMLLNALTGKVRPFEYIYAAKLPDENEEAQKQGAALMVRDSKRTIKIHTDGDTPVIDIKLILFAFLEEYSGKGRLITEDDKKRIEEIVAESIKTDTINLLKYLQSVGTDPVGFGELVRAYHNKYWKAGNWKEVYQNADFQLDVKVNIEAYGAIE